MGANLLTTASVMQCSHAGTVSAVASNLKVKCGGSPVLVQGDVLTVAGCPFSTPAGPLPCVTAQVLVAAKRVKVGGKPVVTQTSTLLTTGSGPPVPVMVVSTQVRVQAT